MTRINLEALLIELANIAWRRQPRNGIFFLSSSSFPRSFSKDNIYHSIALLYSHALIWASGLEIPSSIPTLHISPLEEGSVAGQYSASESGPKIILAEKHFMNSKEFLSILVHECCHHILDISGLRGKDNYLNERKTDLIMFICGFGQIILEGFVEPDISKGNLSYDEACYVKNWTKDNHFKYRRGEGFIEGEETYLFKKIILVLHGDREKADRLIEFAKRKFPNYTIEQRFNWILEDFYRDNR